MAGMAERFTGEDRLLQYSKAGSLTIFYQSSPKVVKPYASPKALLHSSPVRKRARSKRRLIGGRSDARKPSALQHCRTDRPATAQPRLLYPACSSQLCHRKPVAGLSDRFRFSDALHGPDLFSEPMFRNNKGFAVLSLVGEEVTGVLTGIKSGDCIQSGLSVRPQIALRRGGDSALAVGDLIAGLLAEAEGAKLIDCLRGQIW